MINIDEKYFPLFEKHGIIKRYEIKQSVYLQEEEANTIYLIKQGKVKAYLSTIEGENITLEILKKGRIFGDSAFKAKALRPVNIEVIEEAIIIQIEIDKLFQVIKENELLLKQVLSYMTESQNQLVKQIYRLTTYTPNERVIDFLLEERNQEENVNYTQSLMAECLAMHRVSVSKILNELKKQNWIEIKYGKIHIIEVDELRKILMKRT